MTFEVLIPHGGLNGSLDMCVSHILNGSLMPSVIRVLVDSQVVAEPSPWLFRMARERGVSLQITHDAGTTSIIDMRLKLIAMVDKETKHAAFVDDDMLLQHSALFRLYTLGVDYPDAPFIEGHRIEIGGRKDEHFATHERKLVSEGQRMPLAVVQDYGDTALLLINVAKFRDVDTRQLIEFYDGRNIGGSDFALTSLVAQKHGPGRSCREAFGWHTASEQKGYWKNYATADRVFDLAFKQGAPYANKSDTGT